MLYYRFNSFVLIKTFYELGTIVPLGQFQDRSLVIEKGKKVSLVQLGELLKVFSKKFFPKTITFINVSSKVYWRTVFLLKSEHLNLKNHHGSNSLLSYVIFSYKPVYSHTLYQFYIVPLYFNHKRIVIFQAILIFINWN